MDRSNLSQCEAGQDVEKNGMKEGKKRRRNHLLLGGGLL